MSENLQPGMRSESFGPGPLVADHLEPDQLNAFVEGVLPEHERVAALAHIADCAVCRAVVFLAQQAQPVPELVTEEQPSATSKPASSWRSWFPRNSFLVAATAGLAGAVLVMVTLHLHHAESAFPSTVAKSEAPMAAPVSQPVVQAPSLAESPVSAARMAPPKLARPVEPEASAPPPPRAAKPLTYAASPVPQPVAAPQVQSEFVRNQANQAFVSQTPAPVQGPSSSQSQNFVSQAPLSQTSNGTGTVENKVFLAAGANRAMGVAAATPDVPADKSKEVSLAATIANSQVALHEERDALSADALSAQKITSAKPEDKILPSHEQVVSVAAQGERVLAIDAQGNVYRSENSGHDWLLVQPRWAGKAVHVSLVQRNVPAARAHGLNDGAEDVTGYRANAPASAKQGTRAPNAPVEETPFQLTTESGQILTSTDGITWKER